MHNDIESIVLTKEQIEAACERLGKEITADYEGKLPLCVGILKGSILFMADLIKHIDTHVEMEFMDVSSYHGGTESTGEVKILKDLDVSVEGRDIIIIEDILETGTTLNAIVDLLKYRKANSIEIVTLLDKPTRRKVDIEAKYVGEKIPDDFVVGYGLDYQEKYRNLPYIGLLKEEVYTK
ncbi:hypoxanthine phosphoribosyltransferase [Macrococcoides bohemicum]|uniref:hypoxanthine phosphoribosyltransferase n=1 Tax=Macrococcoides bohemicum TaxID=1903056 RepID=UPI000BB59616|nr:MULTISPECIES: hypoxanthine phosphoribosyltransferase [Macrococcus]ATD31705.1 hypoxanthine phosphoribosyltransferase [Macrococcus sp. IME1552]MBC9875643.1 hypoxanthine phosphoribosyltransferase [Macrococcus bohemicus]QRN50868.1 hypoxanthine phosphoribosyltransferase [Macrococcus bohemicus]QYA44709.1 hypoxanthine phosphoribosyltransferase [Macrococcus bohemicus]TDL33341.1 hypoxanthine phosphoribosyltransferase [Macrococcus bohemicus]